MHFRARSRRGVSGTPWLVATCAMVACTDVTDPGRRLPPDGNALSLARASIDPLVTGTGQSARLFFTVGGTEDVSVRVVLPDGVSLLRGGAPVSELTLRDDGTRGDDRPGDGVYTVDGLTVPLSGRVVGSTTIATGTLIVESGNPARSGLVSPRVSIRSADQDRLAIPAITVLADRHVQFTSRIVVIETQVDPVRFAGARDSIVARYYDVFPDDRDWLVVTRAPSAAEIFDGQALRVRNAVTGIGLRVFTSSRPFGSSSRLEFVVELVRDFYWPRGEFDGVFCLLTHELTHRWAAQLSAPLAANSHWTDAFLRTSSGFGWDGRCRLNPLELYLAGRLPGDSVPGPLTAEGMTMDDVIAEQGPRLPATDRDAYTIAFIVVADRLLSDLEIAYFHHVAGEYTAVQSSLGLTFEGATGGRIALAGEIVPRSHGR